MQEATQDLESVQNGYENAGSTPLKDDTISHNYEVLQNNYCIYSILTLCMQETTPEEESGYENSDSAPQKADTISHNYEFPDYEVPFWEPANAEDELRVQLSDSGVLRISGDSVK